MAATSALEILIKVTDQSSAQLRGIGNEVESLGRKVGAITAGLLAAAGIQAGLRGIVDGVKSVTAAADESARVQAQLNAVLKSTGGAAGESLGHLNDLAAGFQKTTTFSDEAVGSVQGLLLTFTSIKGGIFEQSTQAVLDMATALGKDASSAAIQLGKALQDPILGLTSLHRVGIAFTEAQKAQIKTLVESGQKMEAQKVILAELNKEFGGSAAAQLDTYGGKIKQLGNDFDDIKEKAGQALERGLKPLVIFGIEEIAGLGGSFSTSGFETSILNMEIAVTKFLISLDSSVPEIISWSEKVAKGVAHVVSGIFGAGKTVGDLIGQGLEQIPGVPNFNTAADRRWEASQQPTGAPDTALGRLLASLEAAKLHVGENDPLKGPAVRLGQDLEDLGGKIKEKTKSIGDVLVDLVGSFRSAASALFGAPTREQADKQLQLAELDLTISKMSATRQQSATGPGGGDILTNVANEALIPLQAQHMALEKQLADYDVLHKAEQARLVASNKTLLTEQEQAVAAANLIVQTKGATESIASVAKGLNISLIPGLDKVFNSSDYLNKTLREDVIPAYQNSAGDIRNWTAELKGWMGALRSIATPGFDSTQSGKPTALASSNDMLLARI